MVVVLLHFETLHTILDSVQTGCHVQRVQEHVVFVSELSVLVVDRFGSLVVSARVEYLVFVEGKVFL